MRGVDAVVHFAAESHVDRSIVGSDDFVVTNCFGTNIVMDTARRLEIGRVVHIGTDEVYGSVEVGSSSETDPLEPRSPYSASKAGSDLIALSYHHTHGLPVTVTRCTNNFGPVPVPGEGHPALHDQPARRRQRAALRRRAQRARLALRRRPLRGRAPGAPQGRGGRDLQHRRRERDPQPGARRQAAGPARQGRDIGRLRGGPARSRPPLLRRHHQDHGPRLDRGSARSTRRSRRPSRWYRDNAWWWRPLKEGG